MFIPVGKLQRQQPVNATAEAAGQESRLFMVTDRTSGVRFLVDTGAEVSIIPPSRVSGPRRKSDTRLSAANGTSITTYGETSLTLNLGLRRTLAWVFIVADSTYPIIGADFL